MYDTMDKYRRIPHTNEEICVQKSHTVVDKIPFCTTWYFLSHPLFKKKYSHENYFVTQTTLTYTISITAILLTQLQYVPKSLLQNR